MKKERMKAVAAALSLLAFEIVVLCALFGVFPARAAALTDGLAPTRMASRSFPCRMYAGVIYRGGLVAVSNGVAYPAANNAEYRVVGVAEETVDNQSTAAGYSATRVCTVNQGIYAFANAVAGGSGTNAVYQLQVTDVGKPAYVVDDQTVGAASNAFFTVAGTVVYVEPDTKWVWIDVAKSWAETAALQPFDLPSAATGLASGRLYIVNTATITNGVGIVP